MSQFAYALVGLTALIAALVGVLTFVVLRFGSAMRDIRGQVRAGGEDRLFMAAALEDALARLRAQERAMAERAEASERLSDEIVTSLTAGLLVVAMHGEVRILNPAGRRLLGVPADAPPADFRAALAGVPPLISVIDECLATKRPIVRRALELPQPPSAATHVGVTVSPLFDQQGNLHGAICLFTDLTEIIELEEQLRLKDSLSRLGELTAGLAHEFRNGLATIHGYGRLIEISELPAPFRPFVQGIRDETDALGRIVTNFLNFARPAQLSVAPVDLRSLVDAAVAEARNDPSAAAGSIAVAGDYATVDGDEVLLRQAVGNLLRNALEACAAAGIAPHITIDGKVERMHGLVRITVSDNGPGIDPAARDRLFRPFFTTRSGGTGLGLALVQKIVVTHNGRVSVTAASGRGASFQITLPLPPGR
jgi:signal transduction histidine kinase